jgi:hypothetical protein
MSKRIDTAEQTAAAAAAAPSPERRAWEAPRLTSVDPVDRTRGGASANGVENASYKIS